MFLTLNSRIFWIKRKSIIIFKYVRFKSTKENFTKKVSSKEIIALRTKKLSEMLDCSKHTARELISRNCNIASLDFAQFVINATFCSKYLRLSDVIEYPCIVSMESGLLQHRYFSLKELGCRNVSAFNILRFPHIIKQTPKGLSKNNIHFDFSHELDHFMTYLLDSDEADREEIKFRLEKLFQDGSSMLKIKEAMNAEFLSSKLKCSLATAHQVLHRYPPLRLQSVSNTAHLIDLLFLQFNFKTSKIIQVPKLLSVHHETAEYFLDKFPKILGIETIELTQKHPLILRRPTDTIQEVEDILRKFNITDRQLLNCPKVISFSSRTLESRLEYLNASKDFALLKYHKKFLWLVYHFGNLSSRLKILKDLDMPYSIQEFTSSNSSFQNYLSFSKSRFNTEDVSHFLAEFFDQEDIISKLQEFPNTHNACLSNITKVLDFLLDAGVSKKQIYNGLGIVLYDFDIVKEYFNELRHSPVSQPYTFWTSHYNFIQLLIYTIEVDHGFKGGRSYKGCSPYLVSNDFAVSNFA